MATYFGVDLGRKHDSTAIVVVDQDKDGLVRVAAIRELRNVPFEAQVAEIVRLAERFEPLRICVDETGLGLPIVERLRLKLGHRIEGVTFTAPTKDELVSRTIVLLQDRKLRFGVHPRLREELHSISKQLTRDGRVLYRTAAGFDRTGEHHADLAWALMLAVLGIPATRGKAGPVAMAWGPDAIVRAEGPATRILAGVRAREAQGSQVIGTCGRCGGPILTGEAFVGAGANRHARCPTSIASE
jgi:phage FluMu gp28-like protein